jgi:hypothetical protein
MSTVTVSDRTGWLRSSFYRAGQRHDRTGANLQRDDAQGSTPNRGHFAAVDNHGSDTLVAVSPTMSLTDDRELEFGARSQEPGAWSQEPGARSREPGAGSREPGAGGAAADPHPIFHAVNLQIVRLQEQQQQQQQFFAEQLRLLHDHQQQQQTSMERLVQLYQQQQQQQRRHQMFDSCTCQ